MECKEMIIPRCNHPFRLYEHDPKVSGAGKCIMELLGLWSVSTDDVRAGNLLALLNAYPSYCDASRRILQALQAKEFSPAHYSSFAGHLLGINVDGQGEPMVDIIEALLRRGVCSIEEAVERMPTHEDWFSGELKQAELVRELEELQAVGYLTFDRPCRVDALPLDVNAFLCPAPCPSRRLFRPEQRLSPLANLTRLEKAFPDLSDGLFQTADYVVATSPSLREAGAQTLADLHFALAQVLDAVSLDELPLWAVAGVNVPETEEEVEWPRMLERLSGILITDARVYTWTLGPEAGMVDCGAVRIAIYEAEDFGAGETCNFFLDVRERFDQIEKNLVLRTDHMNMTLPLNGLSEDEFLSFADQAGHALSEAKGETWTITVKES